MIAAAGIDDDRQLAAAHSGVGTGCCIGPAFKQNAVFVMKGCKVFIRLEQHIADIGSVISAQALFGNSHVVFDLQIKQELYIRKVDGFGKSQNGFGFHEGPVRQVIVSILLYFGGV